MRAYDPHASLQGKVAELSAQLVQLEARFWQLKDAFYAHTHPTGDDEPRREDEDR